MSSGLWVPTQSAEQRRETHSEPSKGNDGCLRWVMIDETGCGVRVVLREPKAAGMHRGAGLKLVFTFVPAAA